MAHKYLLFTEMAKQPNRKTKNWQVTAAATHHLLGEVYYKPAWRKFIFAPYGMPVNLVEFDAVCLQEIVDFLKAETNKLRQSWTKPICTHLGKEKSG